MIPLRDVIPSRTWPVVTVTLLVLNLVVFVLQASLTEDNQRLFVFAFGLIPARFELSDVITSMFVHGGFAHITGNMLYLWIFGDNVEDRLGHGRFLAFYLFCGAGAAIAQTLVSPTSQVPMVGASGAIAGVLGAYFVLYPRSRVLTLIPFPVILTEMPAVVLLGFWFLMQFLSGVGSLAIVGASDTSGGIAFWAHAMGFVLGGLLIKPLARPERQRAEWWHR